MSFEYYYDCTKCGKKWKDDASIGSQHSCPNCGNTIAPFATIDKLKGNIMSLTRKHFRELAEIFRSLEPDEKYLDMRNPVNATNEFEMWSNLRERIAEFCAKHNDQFDYDRFMKASESHEN